MPVAGGNRAAFRAVPERIRAQIKKAAYRVAVAVQASLLVVQVQPVSKP